MEREAMFYEPKGDKLHCFLCHRDCVIPEGKRGFCGVRENRKGKLYSLVYGKAVSYHVDPIEKKPLFNFHPGTFAFSFSTVGCNFSCLHCQNWEISQARPENFTEKDLPPETIVEMAESEGCAVIAYTYTEPTIFFEYTYDTMKLAKKKNLYNVYVTNGYMGDKVIPAVKGLLDAANVDVKGNEEFYKKVCGGVNRDHILENIKSMKKAGIHVEVTYLIIPDLNDTKDDFEEIADFVISVDKDMPLHFSRFYPQYKMLDKPQTPVETVGKAIKVARDKGVHFVYGGNVPSGYEGENTYCPNCKALLIERYGYQILKNKLKGRKCPECSTNIAVID
jgi:pyruvate formate lyase activating enzyme